MKNKKIFIVISAFAIAALFVTGCGKKAELKDGAEIAVSIKGAKFTATEYYEKIKSDNITTLIDMIDHELLDKEYKTDDKENKAVKAEIDKIKNNYGSDEETYNAILSQYFGVENEEAFEEMLRLEYKKNQAVNDYIEDNLTDKEIKKYYDENYYGLIKASHILISTDVKDDATTEEKEEADNVAKKKAQEVIDKLNKGEKFADLAKEYSTDKSNNEKGGDLDYFDPNDMVDEFKEAVLKLEKNEYTKEPVKTKFGYHIILKTDTKEKEALDKVKDKIKEDLTKKKLADDTSLYYESLVKFRESKGLKWNDSKLEKSYNEYMDNLIEQAKKNS